MSSDRRHSTSPRSSASQQRRNSLDGVIAERAPRRSVKSEAKEEAGGRNALVASTANANYHPYSKHGNILWSTVTNTSNGGVDAASFLSSSLGQAGRDQTCLSTPFILPFDVYVKIAQFVPPDLGQLASLVSVLPPAKREYFLRCYLKNNWSYLMDAWNAFRKNIRLPTFRQRLPLWFSHNPNYLEVLETDFGVPLFVRHVLTNPCVAILVDCVDLLRHILDNTDADVNGMYLLGRPTDDRPRSLLELAISRDRGVCVNYLLSCNDLDVHTVISDPCRDHGGSQLSSSFFPLRHKTQILQIAFHECFVILLAILIALMLPLREHID